MDDATSFGTRTAQLLELDHETEPTSILDALRAALQTVGKPDPRKYVPVETLQEARASRAQSEVDDALRKGYLRHRRQGLGAGASSVFWKRPGPPIGASCGLHTGPARRQGSWNRSPCRQSSKS